MALRRLGCTGDKLSASISSCAIRNGIISYNVYIAEFKTTATAEIRTNP